MSNHWCISWSQRLLNGWKCDQTAMSPMTRNVLCCGVRPSTRKMVCMRLTSKMAM